MLFPAAHPFHPGVCQRSLDTTPHPPIRPSSTAAPTTPPPSPGLSPPRSSQNHPRLHPLRRQIPIVGQAPPTSRGFLPCRLSDAGPRFGLIACQRAGIRNPSQRPPLESRDAINHSGSKFAIIQCFG